ncbi:hypothetical protein V5S96_11065 [Corynebacterium mastitidis]|uniref:Uncharacterized protein n=1 Tax=Corynebacterium mastitidis TaxID=161890 RepID=A0ABU8P0T4_9CORY
MTKTPQRRIKNHMRRFLWRYHLRLSPAMIHALENAIDIAEKEIRKGHMD